MTHPVPSDRPEDRALAEFLRSHRPLPPPPAPDLEARILAEIAVAPPPRSLWGNPWQRTGALAALLATLLAIGTGLYLRDRASAMALAELETFMETSWQGTVGKPSYESWAQAGAIVTEPLDSSELPATTAPVESDG